MWIAVTEPGGLQTVDYVSTQGPLWLLTAGLMVVSGVVIFLMRKLLQEAQEAKTGLKTLMEKYGAVLERSATKEAESSAEVRSFGRQVITALESSTSVIRRNTEAISENIGATKEQTRANEATTGALLDLRMLGDNTARDLRRQGEETRDAIERATEAIEEKEHVRRKPRGPHSTS